ncbi:hypothetical protein H310_09198 [Aphanomyces invadans]|uniref:Lebercilin domain-containing protein n=1 Tax=Aphanomyces invadans TaxID=157072 RepID=A0A024TV15_9STRA|nr:hypothetical protein H310_09198 [Aphanomyces invadans]ETV97873.1 hypothetical protein H310_09198 [Aphanomyces invadans]|eukprot:XP_008873434.1 hypothetical protein H310_09198 [Aphanomyces invadans]
MHSVLHEVLDDDGECNNQAPSQPMSTWSESAMHRVKEDQLLKQRMTRMRAQMQLTISRLRRQNEELMGALTASKDLSAKREKHLVADHAFKLASKERQITLLKRQLAEATTAIKTAQTKFEREVADLTTQVADLKFENKLMQTAYEKGRETWPTS